MTKLNIFEKLPVGYKRIEGPEEYEKTWDTVSRAFADACYPIPSMTMKHEEYDALYGTLAHYWLEHSLKNGDIICSDDFAEAILLSSMDKLCELPLEEIRQKIGDRINPEALENALGILKLAGQDENLLQVRENSIFIEILAVKPEEWGKGRSSKIMREVYKECDAADIDLALLTNSPKNVLIYEHIGFEMLLRKESKELGTVYNYMLRPAAK